MEFNQTTWASRFVTFSKATTRTQILERTDFFFILLKTGSGVGTGTEDIESGDASGSIIDCCSCVLILFLLLEGLPFHKSMTCDQ